MERMFRLLRADEIECRVQQCNKNGVSLLLYKDARTDANVLDETVGVENWQNKFYEVKGNLYCSVGINMNYADSDKPERWLWKDDCGAESNMEKEKGEASDAFKRACATKWGLGRELYTSPFIWVKASDTKVEEDKGKFKCKDSFKVSQIEYENGVISYLMICNKIGAIVYQFNEPAENTTPRKKLIAYCKNNALDLNDVAAKYDLTKDSTDNDYEHALDDLKAGD